VSVGKNPFDRTAEFEFDLPSTESEGDEERDELAQAAHDDERSRALVQKTSGRALTESRAFGILAEFVETQRKLTIEKMLLTPTTEANKDEHNYERGVCHGLMLALRYAQSIAEGAEATLEVFREQEKLDATRTESTH
jgi:hypothetical protein